MTTQEVQDKAYQVGYADGYNRLPNKEFDGAYLCFQCEVPDDAFLKGLAVILRDSYQAGYGDGQGDYELGGAYSKPETTRYVRPVENDYYIHNTAPVGYAWTGEKRTPRPGEWYLSKNGNAILAKKVRGNDQTRHILTKVWGYRNV